MTYLKDAVSTHTPRIRALQTSGVPSELSEASLHG